MSILRLVAAMTLAASLAVPAAAQTVANGPYYATPSWDQTLPSSTRFIVLSNMNSAAVLDRETGLVWEKSPEAVLNWEQARLYCVDKTIGGRKGWRLPTVDELATLYNPEGTSGSPPGKPGSPFVPSVTGYWTSTIFVNNLGSPLVFSGVATAYIVFFAPANFNGGAFPQNTQSTFGAWCVRGGSAGNVQ
jgi:hypothetical protein